MMTDELTWLRELEQEVQRFHREALPGGPVQVRMQPIKERINARIIALLEESTGGLCNALIDSGGPRDVRCHRSKDHTGIHLT